MNSSSDASRKKPLVSFFQVRSWGWWVLVSLPVVVYFGAYAWLCQNLPRNDDPPATLPYLLAAHRGEYGGATLFEPYAEHRIAYVRLMTLLVQRLGNVLDYRILGLIGNLSLLGVLWVFWCWFRRWNLHVYFLPIPFLLFHWGFHHNTFVAMMALQNLTIVFWGVLVAWWLADGRAWRPYAALAVSLVAMYTSGSGMLLVAIGCGHLLLTRHWKALLSWAVVGGLAMVHYFSGLSAIMGSDSNPLAHLGTIAGFIIMMSGSYFDLLPNVLKSSVDANAPGWMQVLLYLRIGLCFLLGLLALAAAGFLIFTQVRRLIRAYWVKRSLPEPESALTFPLLALLFVLGTILVVAQGRYDGGLSQSFAVRYKIYSPVLMSLLYAAAMYRLAPLRRTKYLVGTWLIAAALAGWSYGQNLNQVRAQNRVARAGWFNLRHNGVWLVSARNYGDIDPALNQSIAADLYRPGETLLTAFDALAVRADARLPYWPVRIPKRNDFLTVISDRGGLKTLLDEPAAGAYFVLLGHANRYLTSTEQNRTVLGTYQPGFRAYVQVQGVDVVPGTYRLCVYLVSQGTRRLYDTGQVIRVPPVG